MIFKIDKKVLSDSVNTVARAVPARAAKTALLNLLVSASQNSLRITGTDQEIMMIANIEAEVSEEGHFAIPAKLFQEVISSIPDNDNKIVTVEINDSEGRELVMSNSSSRYCLLLQDASDFPPVPVFGDELNDLFSINSQMFKQGLKEAGIAINTEGGNPVQKSVCVDFSVVPPTMVSTDGHRLAVTALKDLVVPEDLKKAYIVPSRAVAEISNILDENETVGVSIYNQQLVLATEHFQLITRLVDGKFPDYSRVLPKESSRTLKIDRKEFLKALKAVAPIAKASNDYVYFEIGKNETKIWSKAQDKGSAEAFLSTELTGEPIEIAFNLSFIIDFVNSIEDKTVVLDMTTPHYPGMLKSGNPESDYKYVIMPMSC